jgi:hypothetical protein
VDLFVTPADAKLNVGMAALVTLLWKNNSFTHPLVTFQILFVVLYYSHM